MLLHDDEAGLLAESISSYSAQRTIRALRLDPDYRVLSQEGSG